MKRKKLLHLILVGVMAIGVLTGCVGKSASKVSEPLRIAALNGPTGMGMAKLMEEESDKYTISLYQSPDEIVGKLVSGELDIACIPSNLAAVLYQKTQKGISLLGTNTLGVLYIVENGETIKNLEDLKGKKIILSGKGSTPEFIMNNILLSADINPSKDVTIEFMANHTDVVSTVVANPGTIALLPEPHVSIAQAKGEGIKVVLDMNAAWEESESVDLPMGVIVASNTFIKEKENDLGVFLESYKKSVEFVNNSPDEAAVLIEKYKIIPSSEIAKGAIPKCNIVFRDAQKSKVSLQKFYEILNAIEPKSIGGSIPDEAFYYAK